MKRIGLLALSLILSAQLQADTTSTTTTFTDVAYDYNGKTIPSGGEENENGDLVLFKEASIKTNNFKVDNFWEKFREDGNGEAQSKYDQVQKIGTFKLNVQSTFACEKAGLTAEGCSGQKPFLLKDGTLKNTNLRKEADGVTDIVEDDVYRIPFQDAKNYHLLDENGKSVFESFYALDVDRVEDYFKEPGTPPPPGKKNFFTYIIDLFKDYYSADQRVFGDPLNPNGFELRDRYIANIIDGHDQENLLTKKYNGHSASAVNTIVPAANDGVNGNVSLLDYEELLITEESGCKTWLFNLDPDSLRCRMITGFGMANWIPFFSDSTPTFEVQSKSVMADTEATLLALSGELNGKNYITPMLSSDGKSFLEELFKPMLNMMGGMFRFFFGGEKAKTVESIELVFNFDEYLDLTFATTDGTQITGFKHFYLQALESVYGTEVESCTVKETKFGPDPIETYISGIDSNEDFDGGKTHRWIADDWKVSRYNVLNRTSEEYGVLGQDDYTIHLNTDDWLNWCKRRQGDAGKGMFGRFFASLGRMFSTPSTYDGQLDHLLAGKGYSIVEYKEKVHRGLILRLKEHEIEVGGSGSTTTYKLMNVK